MKLFFIIVLNSLNSLTLFQSINQNLYSAPLRFLLIGAHNPCQRKRTVLRRWWNWEQVPFGRCLRSIGRPFQVVLPTTEKEHVSIVAERANGTINIPWTVYDGLDKKKEGGRAKADRRALSQTSTATPRTRSCMICAAGMETSAIHGRVTVVRPWSEIVGGNNNFASYCVRL